MIAVTIAPEPLVVEKPTREGLPRWVTYAMVSGAVTYVTLFVWFWCKILIWIWHLI